MFSALGFRVAVLLAFPHPVGYAGYSFMLSPDSNRKWRLPLTPKERNALLLAAFLFLLGLAVRLFRGYCS
jgi:hypothetical protein